MQTFKGIVMKLDKGNPLAFKSPKIERLDKAYSALIEIVKEYAERENLSEEDVLMLTQLLVEVYSFKKAEYIIDHKLNRIGLYLNTAFCKAFNLEEEDNKRQYTDLLYLKHTKQLLTNE